MHTSILPSIRTKISLAVHLPTNRDLTFQSYALGHDERSTYTHRSSNFLYISMFHVTCLDLCAVLDQQLIRLVTRLSNCACACTPVITKAVQVVLPRKVSRGVRKHVRHRLVDSKKHFISSRVYKYTSKTNPSLLSTWLVNSLPPSRNENPAFRLSRNRHSSDRPTGPRDKSDRCDAIGPGARLASPACSARNTPRESPESTSVRI